MTDWREIWGKDHPVWKLLQTGLVIIGFMLITTHGGAEILGGDIDTTEAVGGAWLLRELVAWRRS